MRPTQGVEHRSRLPIRRLLPLAPCSARRQQADCADLAGAGDVAEDAQSTSRKARIEIRALIGEMEAIGHQVYIPPRFAGLKPHKLVNFGALSYMSERPHYFPPTYQIPDGLPQGNEKIKSIEDIKYIGDANVCLRKRYNWMMRYINLCRFFRHHRILEGRLLSETVPFNNLPGLIKIFRKEIHNVMIVLRRFAGQSRRIFRMPEELLTEVFMDYSLISPFEDYSVLFSTEQVIPKHAYYIFFENTCGLYLFLAKGFQNQEDCCEEKVISLAKDSLHNIDSFCSLVRLQAFFPFPRDSPCPFGPLISKKQGSFPPMLRSFLLLNLPDPSVFTHYKVGIHDDRLRSLTPLHTGIPCTWNKLFQILERGISIYLDHLLK